MRQRGVVKLKSADRTLRWASLPSVRQLQDLFILVCSNAVALLNADGGGLWLRRGHILVKEVNFNLSEYLLGGLRVRVGAGLVGQAAELRTPVVCEDLSSDSRVVHITRVRQCGIRGFLALPLALDGQTVAVLTLVTTAGSRSFSTEEVSLLQLFSDAAVLAIDHCLHRPEAVKNWLFVLDRLRGWLSKRRYLEGCQPVDFGLVHQICRPPKSISSITLSKVYDLLVSRSEPLDCSAISSSLGISPATARRYTDYLVRIKAVRVMLQYGQVGRPKHLYMPLLPAERLRDVAR